MSALNPLLPFMLVWRQKFLLKQMLLRNLALRYHGSMLGFAWCFAQPLLMLAVYTFVFGIIFKARWQIMGLEHNDAAYPLILFCGLAVFQMFSEGINVSGTLIINNAILVKKVIFPLELLPLSAVVTGFIFGLAWFALLFICACYFLHSLSWTMLLLPVTLVPLFFLSAGIAFIVAAFGVYIRDVPQLVGIVMQVLFFITPIFYPISLVPENLRWILWINPLTFLLEETRKLFLYRQQPDYFVCLALLAICWLIFQIGFFGFMKMKKGFADVV